jgi:Sjoegren syndrome nuclear autoantigen 1
MPFRFISLFVDFQSHRWLWFAGIEDLKEKREEVNRQILKDEEEKQKIQNDLRILTERLSRINDSLARKVASRNEYDKTIMETEAAYMKILESSQTLLHVLKRESVNLTKKKQSSTGPSSN